MLNICDHSINPTGNNCLTDKTDKREHGPIQIKELRRDLRETAYWGIFAKIKLQIQ